VVTGPHSTPRLLSEAEELGVCAVCLNDGADEGNVIILCDSCGIAVHQVSLPPSLLPHFPLGLPSSPLTLPS